MIRRGYITGPVLGALWMLVLSITVAVAMSFATGDAFRPGAWLSVLWGAIAGGVMVRFGRGRAIQAGILMAVVVLVLVGIGPMLTGVETGRAARMFGAALLGAGFAMSLAAILNEVVPGELTRHEFEGAVIRFLTGFGYIFFTAIVLIPLFPLMPWGGHERHTSPHADAYSDSLTACSLFLCLVIHADQPSARKRLLQNNLVGLALLSA